MVKSDKVFTSDKKAKRAAEAERENERRARIRAAQFVASSETLPRNVLHDVPSAFTKFDKHGLAIELFFSAPGDSSWSEELANFAFDLTKKNMQVLYEAAPDWGWKDSKKRGEINDSASRFIFARDTATRELVAFIDFRFTMEDEVDVLYVYELQLTQGVQRKGLGKHLMVIVELIARRTGMQWIFLTVLRSNVAAYEFYTSKLRYTMDERSPSLCGIEASHEILSKAVVVTGTR